jgi:membrane protease YdiL (CAAX protease family)
MNRVAGLFRNPKFAWTISLIIVNFLFGLGHINQGITGQVENMIDGALLGVVFLIMGCNLWAAVIAHGLADTIDLVLLYLERYPGV